jgi:hypothetical protein
MRQRLGLPPSLPGGNAEAQTASHEVPQPARADVIVANLSRAECAACMIVNIGQHAIKLEDALCSVPPAWHIPATELPPGGWLRIEA